MSGPLGAEIEPDQRRSQDRAGDPSARRLDIRKRDRPYRIEHSKLLPVCSIIF